MNKGEKKAKGRFIRTLKRDYMLWLFVLPGIVLTFIFSYIPIYGVQIAFRNYNAKMGFFGSPWVGMKHFIRYFNSPYFGQTLKNTFILSVYSIAAGFPLPILLALLLNSFRHKKYGKIIQTVTYAPNFIFFTTKHHDGFCMFDSRYSDYKITAKDCPYHLSKHADITKDLFDAFRAKGIGIAAYFSNLRSRKIISRVQLHMRREPA